MDGKYSVCRFLVVLTLLCFILSSMGCGEAVNSPATLVLRNGNVITMDSQNSRAEAVAVFKNRIVCVGSNEEINPFIGPDTKVINLGGATVLPGLIDAHAHLHSLGDELTYLNITGASSYDELIAKVAEWVSGAQAGEWAIGGRWDHTEWEQAAFPVHDRRRTSAEHPVASFEEG